MEARVKESVLYGSIYEALYKNFIKLEDILLYLLSNKYETIHERKKFCLAYRIVCLFDGDQIVQKNLFQYPSSNYEKHFISLTDNEDFVVIYSYSYGGFTSDMKVMQKMQQILPKANWDFCRIICDLVPPDVDNKTYSANIRLLKYLASYTDAQLLGSDYLEVLATRKPSTFPEQFIIRCTFLKDNASLYWQEVMEEKYLMFAKEHYSKAKFSKEILNMFVECFPNLYEENIRNRSVIANYLYNLPNVIAAYYLGYPLHKYIPSNAKVEERIEHLSKVGIEKYLEELNKKDTDEDIGNKENVHCDKIKDFNSFDIISYYTDDGNKKHKFSFTRPEFASLLSKKKNFYTGEPLPEFLIQEIKSRVRIAALYNLPESKTLSDLLNRKEDKMYDASNENNLPKIHENSSIPDINSEENNEESIDSDEEESSEDYEHEHCDMEISPVGRDGTTYDNMPFIVGRARKENGEETIFKFRLPPDLQRIDEEDLESLIANVLKYKKMTYLGRVECDCEECLGELESE